MRESWALSEEALLWFGAWVWGPWGGSSPGRVERFPLGAVQCSHCLSGFTELGDGPLLGDHPAASLSTQLAKLRLPPSLAAWQEFAEVTRLRFPLSEVWCKRSVSLITLPLSSLPLSSLTPSALFSQLHERFFLLQPMSVRSSRRDVATRDAG